MSSFDQSAQLAKLNAFRNKSFSQNPGYQKQEKALFRARLDQPQILRILPAPDGDIPIKELKFYYNTGITEKAGDREIRISVLSPSSYDESDPIEMFTSMLADPSNEEYASLDTDIKNKLLYSLRPSTKYFLPVVVRGQESQGVKYWGLTEKLLGSLLDNIEKEGSLIYDPVKGRDVKVWIENMGTYRQTKFELGQMSPVSTSESATAELINNQPSLVDQFSKKNFNELKDIINKVLEPYTGTPAPAPEERPATDYTAVRAAAPTTPEPVIETPAPVAEEDPFNDLPF